MLCPTNQEAVHVQSTGHRLSLRAALIDGKINKQTAGIASRVGHGLHVRTVSVVSVYLNWERITQATHLKVRAQRSIVDVTRGPW